MSKINISAGKLRGITRLADESGRFKMMAIDQRSSLIRTLAAKFSGKSEKEVTGEEIAKVKYEHLAEVKEIITQVLSPYSTATLMDPQYGYPYSMEHIPRDVGILLAYEESGYIKAGKDGKERKSRLIDGWSVSKARRAGADAVKLLIPYRPDASEEVCKHQQELVRQVGMECEQYDIPFLLELTSYALEEGKTDSIAFAKKKPEIVAESAAEFSKPEYKVDILKLEFPAELKYAEEYCDRKLFDNEVRPAAYNLSKVMEFCKKVDEASQLPWVILSAGVDIEEFLVNVELATEIGASGFLCGRAIWKEAIDFYNEGIGKVRKFLISKGVDNFKRANEKAKKALPWFEHKRFRGWANVVVASLGPSWYKDF